MGRTSTARKSRPRDAATKVAEHRLSVLELARELGNVAEACRRRGMDRSSFYAWKRRFQTHGFEGLKDLPPIHKCHPQTTPFSTASSTTPTASNSAASRSERRKQTVTRTPKTDNEKPTPQRGAPQMGG